MKKVLFFVILIVSLLIIKNLVFSIYNLWQKQYLIVSAQRELEWEKEQNKTLKGKLTYAASPEFVEEEARNKLFLVKEGEKEILLPPISSQNQDKKPVSEKANWQKWLDLFF